MKMSRIDDDDDNSESIFNKTSKFVHLSNEDMLFAVLKAFHQLCDANSVNRPLLPQISHHFPVQVLKNFAHVRKLRIELSAGDVRTNDGVVLKSRAEFRSTVQSCDIGWNRWTDLLV